MRDAQGEYCADYIASARFEDETKRRLAAARQQLTRQDRFDSLSPNSNCQLALGMFWQAPESAA
jgi:hypothetical protein